MLQVWPTTTKTISDLFCLVMASGPWLIFRVLPLPPSQWVRAAIQPSAALCSEPLHFVFYLSGTSSFPDKCGSLPAQLWPCQNCPLLCLSGHAILPLLFFAVRTASAKYGIFLSFAVFIICRICSMGNGAWHGAGAEQRCEVQQIDLSWWIGVHGTFVLVVLVLYHH